MCADASSRDEGGSTEALKAELLAVLGKGGDGASRMARVGDRKRLEDLVAALEGRNPNAEPAEDMVDPADAVLRHVVGALLEGEAGLIGAEKALREELSAMPQRGEGSRRQLQVRTHASPSPRRTHAVVRWHM